MIGLPATSRNPIYCSAVSARYDKIYADSLANPAAFWMRAAEQIEWVRRPRAVFDDSKPPRVRWFPGAMVNTCYNAVDLHVVAGRGDQAALVYDSPVTDSRRTLSYRELQDEVSRTAGALAALGVAKGDRVLLYMPMIPEAVIGALATARLGAIHSVVFGGFAANELAQRIQHASPKVILTATCGIEPGRIVPYMPLLEAALEMTHNKPQHIVVVDRPQHKAVLAAERDHDWNELTRNASPASCVPVQASEPLYVLYTSGTTGMPKGVVRDNGGHAVALKWSLENVYGMAPGDVFWAASDIGWVVGHSYIIYAPLLLGCTTILYEGKPVGTPDASAFWRVIERHRVNALFTAPTALRAIKREDPQAACLADYDLTSLRTLFLAGERADPDTVEWCERALGVPVIDHWWQTETGWPICGNLMGLEPLPTKAGSATKPVPGFDVQIVDASGDEVGTDVEGLVAIKLPLPPSCLPTIWGSFERFRDTYLSEIPGFYVSGDSGYRDSDGYVFIMGRTDDVINVAGHRLSTGEMEEIVADHPAIAECAVIGVHDALKGQLPVALLLLKDGTTVDADTLQAELVAMVRERIGAVASFRRAIIVQRLPKTRSGKILRKILRQMADGHDYAVPSTIDDPASLAEIAAIMAQQGLITND